MKRGPEVNHHAPGPANQVKSSALLPLFKSLQRRLPGNHSLGSHASAVYATVDLDSANDVYGSSASESVPNASLSTVVSEKCTEKRWPGSGVRPVREITVQEGAAGGADRRIGIQGRMSPQAGSGRTCSTHREEEASVACQGSRVPAPPNQRISQVEGAVQPQSCKMHARGRRRGRAAV